MWNVLQEMTRHLIIVTVPFQMPYMQFHELLLVVLTMPWSTSFPHTCKSSSLTNLSKRLKKWTQELSKRLSRNGPKKPFYLFGDVLIIVTGPCSASPVPTKMSMQTQLPPMSVSVQTLASPQRLSQSMQMTNPGSQMTSNTHPPPPPPQKDSRSVQRVDKRDFIMYLMHL